MRIFVEYIKISSIIHTAIREILLTKSKLELLMHLQCCYPSRISYLIDAIEKIQCPEVPYVHNTSCNNYMMQI